jgi:hypothetical protein
MEREAAIDAAYAEQARAVEAQRSSDDVPRVDR